jgi:hypothetical protein
MTQSTTTMGTTRPGTARAGQNHRRRNRLLAGIAAALVILGGYATWTNVRPYTVAASIRINATPEQVWAVLTDLKAYHDWNPFITSSSGDVRVGAKLTNVMHDSSGDTTFTPTVEVVQPGRELTWVGKVPPGGVFTGRHMFTIKELGPHQVLLTAREDFTGIAVPFYSGHLDGSTLPRFRAMNEALAQQLAS